MEYSGSADKALRTVYIEGIAYLYEFSCGELSGWTYTVNGKAPAVGCDEYVLSHGDVVVWSYTLTLGSYAEGDKEES